MATIKCNVDGCDEQIDSDRIGCKPHWHMASNQTRQRVLTAWRSLQGEQFRNADVNERHRRVERFRQAKEQWKNEVQEALQQSAQA